MYQNKVVFAAIPGRRIQKCTKGIGSISIFWGEHSRRQN